ncbi:hypothetical protein B1A99_12460 [Cohnella sp. CIP 111063]|uniref:hypothetical protein n=1 Tax=unclassified Cohnella TaxID=2636738 RepID=UPI000B8C52B1|nr:MULTISPECIES: hypothetical protein [unclassified Cohnella]OXS58778.1 hypothetical protein B1A99_12460 [Cohnella sp. CIP 111063]PRX71859.1 hypothetical protein B0G52_10758 [Cohnella sp. SGD-V74]
MKLPTLLEQVVEWEKSVAGRLPDWAAPSGLILGVTEDGDGGYECTPERSITFARTGGDGIHFAWIADRRGVSDDLCEAPVICVSPMDFDNPVRAVARNIRDFFSLVFYGHDLLLNNDFGSREHYGKALREQEQYAAESPYLQTWGEEARKLALEARAQFGLAPIDDPYGYIRQVRSEISDLG